MKTKDHQQTSIQRFIEIEGNQVPVTEEVYRAYKRPEWAEHKRKEREKRCVGANGSRCTEDCSNCDKQRTGSVLSLESLFEERGIEQADTVDIAELIADRMLLEELYAALEELTPDNRRIIELFGTGKSEREIAAEFGLSQKAVNKRKTKSFALLRERLSKQA